MPYILTSPMDDDAISMIKYHIDYFNLPIKNVKIFIDIQNMSTGKYYNDNVYEMYETKNEKEVVKLFITELMTFLEDKLSKFRTIGYNNVYFYFYTDSGRNTVNKEFISGWKEKRIKSFLKIGEIDKSLLEAKKWFENLYGKLLSASKELLNTSLHTKMVELSNIDSDFFPYVVREIDRKLNYYHDETLYIIVSNDHDYIHMIDNTNTVRYFFLKNRILENQYNIFKRFEIKFKQKFFDSSDRQVIAKYYSIFHGLIGDSTDDIPPVFSKKSIVYWYKELKDVIANNDIRTWREMILNNEFVYGEFKNDMSKYPDFVKREMVFDFYYFTIWILKYMNIQLDEYDENILKLTSKYFTFPIRTNIEKNSKIISAVLSNDDIADASTANKVLNYFLESQSKSDRFSRVLWY